MQIVIIFDAIAFFVTSITSFSQVELFANEKFNDFCLSIIASVNKCDAYFLNF